MRSLSELEAVTGFAFRNALADIKDSTSLLAASGDDTRVPIVTIAVPTFKRLEFLVTSIGSALRQDFDRPYQILIVDDDPQSSLADQLLERLPKLRASNFRYFVNDQNLGIYDNYNQGLVLADSDWITFLDDDDILDPDFLSSLFAIIDKKPHIEALMPSKTIFDERQGRNWSPENRPLAWRIAKRVLAEWVFLGAQVRRIRVRKFFWGAVIGGVGGFLFKRERAIEAGGLYSEQFPASDFWMMARFAKLFGVYQARQVTYRIRIRENETSRPATVLKGLRWGYKLQTHLVGREVPRWYARLLPLLIAQHRAEFRDFWRSEVPKEELEEALQIKLPKERRLLLRAVQTALRGF